MKTQQRSDNRSLEVLRREFSQSTLKVGFISSQNAEEIHLKKRDQALRQISALPSLETLFNQYNLLKILFKEITISLSQRFALPTWRNQSSFSHHVQISFMFPVSLLFSQNFYILSTRLMNFQTLKLDVVSCPRIPKGTSLYCFAYIF